MCCKKVINTSQWLTLERHQHTVSIRGDGCHIPEVRDEVGTEDLEKSKPVGRVVQGDEPEKDTNIGNDDLSPLVRREHGSGGFEVWDGKLSAEEMKKMTLLTVGARGVTLLTGRIEDQIGGPTPQLMGAVRYARSDGR